MRKLFLTAALLVSVLVGCSKNDEGQSLYKENDLTDLNLKVNLKPNVESPVYYGTKATGSDHSDGTYDDAVTRLDVFIFDVTTGELESYKGFEASELTSLKGLSMRTKTGNKRVYVIANANKDAWLGIITEKRFLAVQQILSQENYQHFIMSGYTNCNITASCTVEVTIQKLVGRVVLNSIRTAFTGTPYAGKELQNVKAYLTNVNSNILAANGNLPTPVTVLNIGKYVPMDNMDFLTPGAMYDEIGSVKDEGHNTPHYFYCYPNTIDEESDTKKFTRLVIEGTLNGKTYYYPININRENYGWTSSIDHKGIMRNKSYTYNVTILRPGSTDPDELVDLTAFAIDVTIEEWDNIPASDIEF